MATANPCSASFLSQLFSGNAIVCSQTFQQSQVADAVQQQADTLSNVEQNYGSDSIEAQVAAQSTAAAEAAATSDTTSIDAAIAASDAGNPLLDPSGNCSGVDLSIVGFGCISSTYIYIGIAVIALLLLTVFFSDLRALIGR